MTQVEWQNRAIAMAGLLQAVYLVDRIARTGLASQDAIDSSIRSIFVQNPKSVGDIFCGVNGIGTGLGLLADILAGWMRHRQLMEYAYLVIKLERNLASHPAVLREVGARIASIDEQRMLRDAGEQGDEETIRALAALYQDTLSRISPRIRVTGKREHLQSPVNTARIRALLLAGVRAAVLWQQVGGRRWHLLLSRQKLSNALREIK